MLNSEAPKAMPALNALAPPRMGRYLSAMRLWMLRLSVGCLIVPAAQAAPDTLLLGTSAPPTSLQRQWYQRIYTEALRRHGLSLAVEFAPLSRLNLMAERGQLDGDMMRAPAYGLAHPEMVKVDMPMLHAVFSLYATQPMPALKQLDDLRSAELPVAYQRGVVGCAKLMTELLPARSLTAVSSTTQGLAMLSVGHAKVFCEVNTEIFDDKTAAKMFDQGQLHKLFDVGATVPLGMYLHSRHAALAEPLALTLKRMKDEGLFERYLPNPGLKKDFLPFER